MGENIGVTDWFTKVRTSVGYGDESNNRLATLIGDIARELGGKNVSEAAGRVSRLLEQDELLKSVCSDSRLPVCSLYHHLRNTAAIAVCQLVDLMHADEHFIADALSEYKLSKEQIDQYSKDDVRGIVLLASLFHDLGKVRTYSSDRKNVRFYEHVAITEEIVHEILKNADQAFVSRYGLSAILPRLASHHHGDKAQTRLEQLIHSGDMISSSADRRYEVSGEVRDTTLVITSHDPVFPHEINCNDGDYACMETPHTILLGYKQTCERRVTEKKTTDTYRILFKDSVVSGGPGYYAGHPARLTGSIGYFALDVMQIQEFIAEAEKLQMLRGGSEIVSDILEDMRNYIADQVCHEAVLFADGGNLISFVPVHEGLVNRITMEAERIISSKSGNCLRAAIVYGVVPLAALAGEFQHVLETIFDALNAKKQAPVIEPVIHPPTKDQICEACRNRLITGNGTITIDGQPRRYCQPCVKKHTCGRETRFAFQRRENESVSPVPVSIIKEHNLAFPNELTEIADSIAVIVVDGNMMGRLFSHTKTPAEYTFKSEEFSRRFVSLIRETLKEFILADLTQNNSKHWRLLSDIPSTEHNSGKKRRSCGFDVVYAGGDDLLIIMNARAALDFCRNFIMKVAEAFAFSRRLYDGAQYHDMKYYSVTVSCGVAIADAKFPIYFLLDKAREMEKKAKEAFRKGKKTDDLNLFHLPAGALAFTSVQGAMPSHEYACYVFGDDEVNARIKGIYQTAADFDLLMEIARDSLDENKKTIVRDLVTCGESVSERLNCIKSNYASVLRKPADASSRLCMVEQMAAVVNTPQSHAAVKMLVPFYWHQGGEA